MNFDVIIIGAGPAGLTSAYHIAKAGNKVLLLDKLKEDDIGKNPPSSILKTYTFTETGFPRPQGNELLAFIDTLNIYSPTAKNKKEVKYNYIIIDRILMSKRLLGYVKEQSVIFRDNIDVSSLIIENEKIVGITTSSGENITSKIVIDAGGITSHLKASLPNSFKIEEEITTKCIANAYIEKLTEKSNPTQVNSFIGVKSGNVWLSPIEIGCGSFDHSVDLKSTLHEYIKEKSLKATSDSSKSSKGSIAVRQNLPNFVGNGFAVVGDSACMVSSLDGAGVTTSMIGAKMLAETVNECLKTNDFSQKALWKYNLAYNTKLGADLAYMDILRRALIGLTPDDIDFAFKNDIITSKDILDCLTGDITNIKAVDKARRALKGITKPHILLRLEVCIIKAKELKYHYLKYPSNPENYDEWLTLLNHINNSFV